MRPVLAFLTLASLPLAAQQAPMTLAQMRDNSRPVLIFAQRPDDPQMLIQLRILHDHAPEAAERQLVPVAVPLNVPSPTEVALSEADGLAARRRFHVEPGEFTVILIGKDGGEKLRAHKPIAFQKLADTVDAMPMRQQEMGRH